MNASQLPRNPGSDRIKSRPVPVCYLTVSYCHAYAQPVPDTPANALIAFERPKASIGPGSDSCRSDQIRVDAGGLVLMGSGRDPSRRARDPLPADPLALGNPERPKSENSQEKRPSSWGKRV